jgi:predicted phosphodiesterase
MRVLIYSDVHGNLPAFEAMLKSAGNCDLYVSLGDLVNYGPWSNECVELALSLGPSILLMGNHEEAFIKGEYRGSKLVEQFFNMTNPNFRYLDEIRNFKESARIGDYQCIHTLEDRYIYPDTNVELSDNFFIGHSHYQFGYENNDFMLNNVGSVGQNRQDLNTICYGIYDLDRNIVKLESLYYDASYLIQELTIRNYPIDCISYYSSKLKK